MAARTAAGLSQMELAARIETDQADICATGKWSHGAQNPNFAACRPTGHKLVIRFGKKWVSPGIRLYWRRAQMVLRSKTPDLVRQEFYGLLMAHFAIRGLMHEAALHAGEDPDRMCCIWGRGSAWGRDLDRSGHYAMPRSDPNTHA
jgi:hypothetical protein